MIRCRTAALAAVPRVVMSGDSQPKERANDFLQTIDAHLSRSDGSAARLDFRAATAGAIQTARSESESERLSDDRRPRRDDHLSPPRGEGTNDLCGCAAGDGSAREG